MKKLFSFISVFALAATLGFSTVSAQKTILSAEKLWSKTLTDMGVTIADTRYGTGWDGKVILLNKANQSLVAISAEGKDTLCVGPLTVAEGVTAKLDGSAYALDDAGNFVMVGTFPNTPSHIVLRKADGSVVKDLAITGLARTDYINATGDVFSAEGGYVFVYGNSVNLLVYAIANGELVGEPANIAGSNTSNNYVIAGNATKQIVHHRTSENGWKVLENGAETLVEGMEGFKKTTMGGDIITLGGKELYIYPTGKTDYSSEFSIRNMTDGSFVTDKTSGETILCANTLTVYDKSYITACWLNTSKIDDNNAYIHVYTADGAAVWKVSAVVAATVTLNVNDSAMGTVEGAGDVAVGGNATIKATPNVGHSFVHWMSGKDTIATTAEYTFKVEKDTTLTAVFQAEDSVKLTLAVNDATKGSITVSDSTIKMGENTVAYGTPVTLTAVPVEGATFNGWYKGEELYSADYTINVAMTADLALTAKFVKVLTLAYELNGGVTNDYGWTSKGALMLEIQNDYNAAYSASLAVVKEENGIYYFQIGEEWMTETKAQGQPYGVTNFFQAKTWSADQKCGKLFLDIQKEKYAFLVDIIDHFMGTAAVGRGTDSLKNMAASASDAYFRADVSGFMLCSPAGAGYPYTCDWTKAGKPDAYVPVWKHAFANPTEIVTEVVLNAPYKEGLTFAGWYATADFSGEPITKVSPESVIEGGKLYAKWIQYIPTIAEVRAMEDGTKTMAAGYVNHVGGNTIYIEDASGFGMDIYMKNSGIKAGQQVVVSGTFTTSKGWPRLNGDSVVSATVGEALGVTSVSTLTALVNDTVFAYYGKRVAINGLKVAKYDDKGDAYFTDGVDTVQGYYMRLDQTTFPVGQKVVIDGAIAAWYGSNFQFTGDVASVTVAAAAGKDKYEYPARGENGEYTLTNNWVISQREGTYSDNAPGATLTVRGMAAKDGMMYFIRSFDAGTNSTLPLEGQIIPVNSATGEMLDPIAIKGEHLFEVQNEDGTWSKGVTVAFNDIKVDHAGNLLIGAITGNSNTFFIYKVDPKTGEATEVIKQKVQDYIKQPDGTAVTYRFDAFGVYGDVDGNACVMAADAQSLNTYRWIITDGKVGEVEQIQFDLDPQYDESLLLDEKTGQKKQNSFSTAPQIFPQDEVGSLFYVDGKDILPMLVDEDGVLVGDFISVPTGTSVWNAGDTATIDGGLNGLCEFKVGNEYFFLFGATNFNKTPSSAFALYKFADESREFGGLEPLWYFPQNGLGVQERAGEIKNGCFAAVPSVEVKGNVATIYIYSVDLGYGVYTFTCPVVDGVENVDTETIEAHKLIENGQVYIIKNGVKYNVLGVTVK